MHPNARRNDNSRSTTQPQRSGSTRRHLPGRETCPAIIRRPQAPGPSNASAPCPHKRAQVRAPPATGVHNPKHHPTLVFGMRKNILERSETRQKNLSFHMKRKMKKAHFMKNTLFFEKMRKWHPNQSHCDASGSTIRSLKHSLFLTLWCLGICILVFPRGFWMVVVFAC